MNTFALSSLIPIPTLFVSLSAVIVLLVGVWGWPADSPRSARGELVLTLFATFSALGCALWAGLELSFGPVPEASNFFQFDALAGISTLLVSLSAAASSS